MKVYVVMMSPFGDDQTYIHSVWANNSDAEEQADKLEGQDDDEKWVSWVHETDLRG